MSNLHPWLIHFPLALLTMSFCFDLVGILRQRSDLQKTGWWMMLWGFVGMIGAIASGLLAESAAVVSAEASGILDDHKQTAFLAVIVFAILLLWRVATKSVLPNRGKWLYWTLYTGGVLLLWMVARYGGILVYRFGVSVDGS